MLSLQFCVQKRETGVHESDNNERNQSALRANMHVARQIYLHTVNNSMRFNYFYDLSGRIFHSALDTWMCQIIVMTKHKI